MSLLQLIRFSLLTDRLANASRWSPHRIARLQRWRLVKLLRFARQRSAFYREKLQGLDLATVSLDQVPHTTKDEIRDNFENVLTDPAVRLKDVDRFLSDEANLGQWFRGRYAVSHTSG